MKFAHLLVAAHFAERPEPGPARRNTSRVAAQEFTGGVAISTREEGDGGQVCAWPRERLWTSRSGSGK